MSIKFEQKKFILFNVKVWMLITNFDYVVTDLILKT